MEENYLPMHGHKLVAGILLRALPSDAKVWEVLVNEQLIKRLKVGMVIRKTTKVAGTNPALRLKNE
ncbi:MAG: hypothetical protein ABI477_08260 [Chryseolinea sp.]